MDKLDYGIPGKKSRSSTNTKKIVLVVTIGTLLVVAIYFTNLKPATISDEQLQKQNIEFLRQLLNDKNFLSNVSNLHNSIKGASANKVGKVEHAQSLTTTTWINTVYGKDDRDSIGALNDKTWNVEKANVNNHTKGRASDLYNLLKNMDKNYYDIETTSSVQARSSIFVATNVDLVSADEMQPQIQNSNTQIVQTISNRDTAKFTDAAGFNVERNYGYKNELNKRPSPTGSSKSAQSDEQLNNIRVNDMIKQQYIRNNDENAILKNENVLNLHTILDKEKPNPTIVSDKGDRAYIHEEVNDSDDSLIDTSKKGDINNIVLVNEINKDQEAFVEKQIEMPTFEHKEIIEDPTNEGLPLEQHGTNTDISNNEKSKELLRSNEVANDRIAKAFVNLRQAQKQVTIPKDNIQEKSTEDKNVHVTVQPDNAFVLPTTASFHKQIHHPENINIVPWDENIILSTRYKCVLLQTVASFPKVCIHSVTDDPVISGHIQSRGTWEVNSMRDVQLALLENENAGLIDIGAGIGEYSLAAASLDRQVVAVEPSSVHLGPFQLSVKVNDLSDRITLMMNVVSDTHGKVTVYPSDKNFNEINIKPLESHVAHNGKTVDLITLNDIASVCTFKTAVLKIDIPGYVQKALAESKYLFKTINITHVFMHWISEDKPLCKFLAKFFTDLGYSPYSEIFSNKRLDVKQALLWKDNNVVWKRM